MCVFKIGTIIVYNLYEHGKSGEETNRSLTIMKGGRIYGHNQMETSQGSGEHAGGDEQAF
jgi:hypothetical protein